MRTRVKDIYLMKKLVSAISAIFIFFTALPSYADQPINQIDLIKTNEARKLIELDYAHNKGLTGKDQVIVIIDDGVNLSNPSLEGKIVDGYCSSQAVCGNMFKKSGIEAGANFKPANEQNLPGHGTLVASIAAGRKTDTFPGGIAPDAKIISINNNNGNHDGIILAFDWILSIKDKYNIVAVNASFGFNISTRVISDYCPLMPDMNSRIEKLYNANIPLVAAAGNNGSFITINFPACHPMAIAVGATNEFGAIEGYSNISKEITVLTPASFIGASGSNQGYYIGGGTSTAAPATAGAIAILKQYNSKLSITEIKNILSTSNKHVDDIFYGNLPILSMQSALNAVEKGSYSKNSITKILHSSNEIPVSNNSQNVNNELSNAISKIDILQKELDKLKQELDNTNKKVLEEKSLSTKLNSDILELKKVNAEISKKNKTLCVILKKKSSLC